MRLIELEPKFKYNTNDREIGIAFNCPCKNPDCYIHFLPFSNPRDGGPTFDASSGRPAWTVQGDDFSFETMTLTPSIQRLSPCRHHFHITGGEITP